MIVGRTEWIKTRIKIESVAVIYKAEYWVLDTYNITHNYFPQATTYGKIWEIARTLWQLNFFFGSQLNLFFWKLNNFLCSTYNNFPNRQYGNSDFIDETGQGSGYIFKLS